MQRQERQLDHLSFNASSVAVVAPRRSHADRVIPSSGSTSGSPSSAAGRGGSSSPVSRSGRSTTRRPLVDLGSDYFSTRVDPDRETGDLIRQLQALGHTVTLAHAA